MYHIYFVVFSEFRASVEVSTLKYTSFSRVQSDVCRERSVAILFRKKFGKIRFPAFPCFFSQMSKLYRARSPLYRRQILQENIRWKALDEIYKIYMPLHRSDLNISEKIRQTVLHFLATHAQLDG